jgi:hypothetical protein
MPNVPRSRPRVAGNIRVLSIATPTGEAIGHTAREESVSSLFDSLEIPLRKVLHRAKLRISACAGMSGACGDSYIASRINRL